jgi:hypothetical protein
MAGTRAIYSLISPRMTPKHFNMNLLARLLPHGLDNRSHRLNIAPSPAHNSTAIGLIKGDTQQNTFTLSQYLMVNLQRLLRIYQRFQKEA